MAKTANILRTAARISHIKQLQYLTVHYHCLEQNLIDLVLGKDFNGKFDLIKSRRLFLIS